jgi:predicted RNA-binding protein YlxR (DUF448 family)
VGCRSESEPGDLVRLVLDENASIVVDLAARSFGRGAWVHPRPECLSRAARGGAEKSLRAKVHAEPSGLVAAVRAAADRRVQALLGSARGAGKVAAGSDAAQAAFEGGGVELVVVARDARSAASAGWLARAAGAGKVVTWGDKEALGRATARPDTALVAVSDRGLAGALSRAVALSSMPEPDTRPTGRGSLVEVR